MNSNSLTAGTVLKGSSYSYEIVKTLGQGSFGITYLAKAKVRMEGSLGSFCSTLYVAIKEFFMKEINGREGTTVTCGSKGGLFDDYRRKFVREAANLSKLKHPNIVNVLEAFEVNNTCYYVMEYIDGGSLDDMIARQHGLSELEAVKYARQIAKALAFMHDNKMLHLDLKPGNVMINDGHAVLIDFGLSKQYDASGEPESSTTIGSGTPGYAPLEQANHRDGNGFPVTMDVYALGATMFKMLTGERPPIASDILNDDFPSELFKNNNPELAAVVEKAMMPMKKQRFQTIGEFVAALESCGFGGYESEDTVLADEEPVVVINERPYADVHEELITDIHERAAEPKNTINGHEYVDLGLSVKWATCNVGAEKPFDKGDYFAWGEIKPKSEYTEKNSLTYKKDMGDISGSPRYDVARVKWGEKWRIPTNAEMCELIDKCKHEWTTQGGREGLLVTGPNGKSVFLPAAGWRHGSSFCDIGEFGSYWSSKPNDNNMDSAYYLCFYGIDFYRDWNFRYYGRSVRPVSE